MPSVRKTSVAMLSCSHALGLVMEGDVEVTLGWEYTGLAFSQELQWGTGRVVVSEAFIVDQPCGCWWRGGGEEADSALGSPVWVSLVLCAEHGSVEN